MTIESTAVYRRSDDVVSRQVGREAVLVPVRASAGTLDFIYTLSPVAARVWALLDGEHSVDAVTLAICDEFDVDAGTARADLEELLADLEGVSLVKRLS